jgi:nucleoside 2-deoxyribosyltransferase
MRTKSCYLAGPIENADDAGSGWRNRLTPELEKRGFKVRDPLKKDIQEEGINEKARQLVKTGQRQAFLDLFTPIMDADLVMIERSDFVIVYWNIDIPSWGTSDETWHAYCKGIPIYIVLHGNKTDVPLWKWCLFLRGGEVFDSFPQLVEFLDKKYADYIKENRQK